MRPNLYTALFLLALLASACSPYITNSPTATSKIAAPVDPPAAPSATPTEMVFPRPDFPSCDPYPASPFDGSTHSAIISTPSGGQTAPTLRALAEARGFYIGAATDPAYLRRQEHADLLARQFNMLAVENAMKWEVIHPEPERYDFAPGDALVAFAQANRMAVYGHVLVWDLQQPAWLTESERTREEWIQILCQHIKTVVGHYRGQIYAWDVVNEAFDDNGALRNTHWLRVIGPEYIPMAFQWAREADPDALLIYNDFSAEGMNPKSQAIYVMIQSLLKMDIPIDGVGLQMHVFLDGPPTPQELAQNMRRLADLGLQVHITEMDVRTHASQASPEEKMAAQAEVYRAALAVCLQAPNCNVFVTWGLSDRYSWIPGYFKTSDAPLLFDESGQPKPAFQAVLEELQAP